MRLILETWRYSPKRDMSIRPTFAFKRSHHRSQLLYRRKVFYHCRLCHLTLLTLSWITTKDVTGIACYILMALHLLIQRVLHVYSALITGRLISNKAPVTWWYCDSTPLIIETSKGFGSTTMPPHVGLIPKIYLYTCISLRKYILVYIPWVWYPFNGDCWTTRHI